MKYSWPGNVRELGNIIEYAVTMVTGDTITADVLPHRLGEQTPLNGKASSLNLSDLTREAITKALALAAETGRKDDAAKLLGISRATLYRKIKEYNVVEKKKFF